MTKWRWALLLLVSDPFGCFAKQPHLHPHVQCPDGLPPKIEQRIDCPPDGICSVTCAPGRWTPKENRP